MYRGKLVNLRSLEFEDLEASRKWVNDSEVALSVDRARPVSRVQQEQWYSRIQASNDCVFFAVETTDKATHIGNVWLWNIDWRHRKAELRVLIGDKDYQGRGYGTEAIHMTTFFAFQGLNLNRVYAYILSNNSRAKRAFEKGGFFCEGILKADRFVMGRYLDVFCMGFVMEPDKAEDLKRLAQP
jgi:RimJ/RimL family protein N-acetyltransferase